MNRMETAFIEIKMIAARYQMGESLSDAKKRIDCVMNEINDKKGSVNSLCYDDLADFFSSSG